jgi:hypothetical protein
MLRCAIVAMCLLASTAGAQQPSPPGAKAYFIEPSDGAVVANPVRIVMGLKGMGIAPAGVKHANTGHHHLIIDADFRDLDFIIPHDGQHLHFGGGQTETEITLPPGPHTLYLVLGDEHHIPHLPPVVSKQIRIVVADDRMACAAPSDCGMLLGAIEPAAGGAAQSSTR